jgi:hypothetical protein
MHTSYKELNLGIARKEQREYQTMNKKQYKSSYNQQRPKDPKQNELRTRTESWHRVRKEEHKGESKHRVSKAVLANFGCQINQKVKRQSNTATSFLGLNPRFQKLLLQKY